MSKKDKPKSTSKIEIKIPQMGEGLREVKIIKLLKNSGDLIQKDEIIFEMETDKSTIEIESTDSGVLDEWLVEEGDTVPVGEIIGYIDIGRKSKDKIQFISPRTRSYGKKLGLSLNEMQQIPKQDSKLMPEDIDRYLLKDQNVKSITNEIGLSSQQNLLIERFKRSQQKVVSASLTNSIDMNQLKKVMTDLIKENNLENSNLFISEFQVFSYLVSRITSNNTLFCSTLVSEKRIKTSEYLNLGIAVYTEKNELVTAVIEKANSLTFPEFIKNFQGSVSKAIEGYDQAKLSPHIILSYMGEKGGLFGSPLLVEPAVATLYLGKTIFEKQKSFAYVSLTFDHRVINGMEAVSFLNDISLAINDENFLSSSIKENEQIEERVTSIENFHQWLLEQISNLLDIDVKKIDLNTSLGIQGMDSLKAIDLIKKIEKTFNLTLSPTILWHYSNFNALFSYLTKQLDFSDNQNIDIDHLVAEIQSLPPSELKDILQLLKHKSK